MTRFMLGKDFIRFTPLAKKQKVTFKVADSFKYDERDIYKALRQCAKIEGSRWKVVTASGADKTKGDVVASSFGDICEWLREWHDVATRVGPYVTDACGKPLL